MNRVEHWFDITKPIQWALLGVGLALGLVAFNATKTHTAIRTPAKVVRVVQIMPESAVVRLGESYKMSALVMKIRDDCENGRIQRHMLEINNGWFYKVEDRNLMGLPASPDPQPLSFTIPTEPLDPRQRELMQPGLWQIITNLDYDCPDGQDGTLIDRSYRFSSPPFTVTDR